MYESEIVDLSGFISDSHYIQILIGINKSPLIDEEIKELLPSPDNI
jgi:hypothetical protein